MNVHTSFDLDRDENPAAIFAQNAVETNPIYATVVWMP